MTTSARPIGAADGTATPAAAPRPAWTLLRETMFRRYWTAAAVSFVGDQVSLLALPLLAVLTLHATPAQMGYLTAAGLAPSLIFSVLAGVWVDRRPQRRRVMVAADVIRALLVLSIPVAALSGVLGLAQLYVVAFLVGTCAVFFEVANGTLFVSLVRPDAYVQASSLIHGSRSVSFVAGPSLAGAIVQLLGAPVALMLQALSYVASALLLGRTKAAEPPPDESGRGRVAAIVRFLREDRALATILASVATVNLFNYMFSALLVLYVTVHLGVSPGLLGVVLGSAAVGALLGSAVTGWLTRLVGVGPAYVIGLVAFPLPLLLIPLAGGPRPVVLVMLVLAEALAGLGVMILDITAGSLMAALIPHRMRARVSGLFRTVNYGVRPVGALLGGAVGTLVGVRTTLWIAGVGAVLGVLWLLRSPVLRLRTLPNPRD
ncbi:MAG: MFS transporter [Micromonosporaceae bacterium]|nr:MFS transporter [Micromonosporaceae bacterium]